MVKGNIEMLAELPKKYKPRKTIKKGRGMSCAAIFTLLYFCNTEYRNTFYGTWTSKTFQKYRFDQGSDRTKFTILTTVHRSIWKSFEVEMEEWLTHSWDSLHQEKPDWFTESAIAHIPSDMIPHWRQGSVREEAGEKETIILASKRRMSVLEGLGSAVGFAS